MRAELNLLHLLLVVGMVVAPLATSRFFLERSRLHDLAHAIALALTSTGLLLDLPLLTFAWLLFCGLGFALFLHQRFRYLFSLGELAKCVPYTFSLIASTWLVSGANGYGLLSYGKDFSYYAALHGHFLGWTIVAGLAFLANQAERFRRFYLASVFVCLVSFLLIAFGIDGVAAIKPIGVVGLTLTIGLSQLLFLVLVKKESPLAFVLGLASLLGFAFTMTLAWLNELGALSMAPVLGARTMVSLHGLANGLIVAPCFIVAIYLSNTRKSRRAK